MAHQSLFFLVYVFYPRIDIKPQGHDLLKEPPANELQQIREKARDSLVGAQRVIEEQAYKHWTPQPAFGWGDFAYLLLYQLNTNCPCRKLSEKFIGSVVVLKRIGTKAYKLVLPVSMKVHLVFPVEFPKPASCGPLPSKPQFPRPPPLIVKGEDGIQSWEDPQLLAHCV